MMVIVSPESFSLDGKEDGPSIRAYA